MLVRAVQRRDLAGGGYHPSDVFANPHPVLELVSPIGAGTGPAPIIVGIYPVIPSAFTGLRQPEISFVVGDGQLLVERRAFSPLRHCKRVTSGAVFGIRICSSTVSCWPSPNPAVAPSSVLSGASQAPNYRRTLFPSECPGPGCGDHSPPTKNVTPRRAP